MEIKKIASNCMHFISRRFIELIGLMVATAGVLLIASLITYSPEDPNFIFPDNTEIKNILGFKGSFTSDLFFQSIGYISILLSITLFISGLLIIINKKIIILIENLFFSIFYPNSFWLLINGSGGFVGKLLENTFFGLAVKSNFQISYYLLILIVLILFLISVNFKTSLFLKLIKKIYIIIFYKTKKLY